MKCLRLWVRTALLSTMAYANTPGSSFPACPASATVRTSWASRRSSFTTSTGKSSSAKNLAIGSSLRLRLEHVLNLLSVLGVIRPRRLQVCWSQANDLLKNFRVGESEFLVFDQAVHRDSRVTNARIPAAYVRVALNPAILGAEHD